jgi:hypothetical protein
VSGHKFILEHRCGNHTDKDPDCSCWRRRSHPEAMRLIAAGTHRFREAEGDEKKSLEVIDVPNAAPPRAQSIESTEIELAYVQNSKYQQKRIDRYGELNRVELAATGIATKEYRDTLADDKPLDPTVRLP